MIMALLGIREDQARTVVWKWGLHTRPMLVFGAVLRA